jgi:hypothetical protein
MLTRSLVPYANAMLVPLPDGISARPAAGASDNLADAYRCVAPQLAQLPGAPVLIAGGGGIALYAADIARRLGSERVSLYAQQRVLIERAQAPRAQGEDWCALGDGSPEAGIVRAKSPGTPRTPENAKLQDQNQCSAGARTTSAQAGSRLQV